PYRQRQHVATAVTQRTAFTTTKYIRPPDPSDGPVKPGEENTLGPVPTWRNVRNTVLSPAAPVGPLSTANHCRSSPVLVTQIGFFCQVLPPSFDTEHPRFASASRSTK